MTVFYFIRHAHHDLLGRELVGRRPGVRLSARGREEAARLGRALAGTRFAALLSSPRQRCRETALPIAAEHGLEVTDDAALDEVDFGDWTGRSFAELKEDAGWQHFNGARSRAAIPGGERMIEVQTRIIERVEALAERHAEGRIALVSHGDVIRAGLVHYLGMPLDFIHRIDIAPASVSLLQTDAHACRVLGLNLGPDAAPLGTAG